MQDIIYKKGYQSPFKIKQDKIRQDKIRQKILRIRQKRGKKNMKKIILSIFVILLTLSPNKAEANQAGLYEESQDIVLAPKQTKDDYYWYDEDFDEIILSNDRLEPDENTERDWLLKNQSSLGELDKMYLNYLNAKALDYTYYTLNLLMKNIIRLDEMMEKVPPNNKELDSQRGFYLNRLRWHLNEAAKYPPIG